MTVEALRAAIRRKYKTPADAVMAALDCSLEEAERLLAAERRGRFGAGDEAFPGMALDTKGHQPMAYSRTRRYGRDEGPGGPSPEEIQELIERLSSYPPEAVDAIFQGVRDRRATADSELGVPGEEGFGPNGKRWPAEGEDRRRRGASDAAIVAGAPDFYSRFPSARRIGSLD
jgi:hypothetical protein